MEIIKLDATESTNSYLKELVKRNTVQDFAVVVAKTQTKGRGQMDSSWQTEPGKNLTFSVLKEMSGFTLDKHFILNMSVALAVYNSLKSLQVPRIKIKWPNDIMSGSFKICGILIENIISGTDLKSAIIGIGLNVNQIHFPGNPKASSLKNKTQKDFDLDELLHALLQNLKSGLSNLEIGSTHEIYKEYQSNLFRRGVASTFQNMNGSTFSGIILGVSKEGMLLVQLENDTLQQFDIKEIKLLF
ncbi:biotin--[acetyl-CoA-carboxylase] ligase [Maribacter cobaltidurans]|uniref:Biotin--[acetyl-CoA-carboxylase] ligase n=1 Tax=Maribacter cobaltidurans TaxID=1178778 RepID=A0A223V7J7_9FLAO|nr:biotin--[acetyl-CoA-carboxylase] ligase [Maribacter cobaltidurans]ASV31262.1 biotin--[acetyl-CoA-carboxylase] ligase [Maribacter cobaltidurans]GGD83776.1 biotin--[acetyl-CoA-carboxylase] ligase [Maribacter cobaltidurans]